jgi:hypothetical protein
MVSKELMGILPSHAAVDILKAGLQKMADLAGFIAVPFDIWALFKQHILLTVLVCLIGRIVHRRYFSPLSSYPGPFLASFTRLWKVWSVYKGHAQEDCIRMHRKYGKLACSTKQTRVSQSLSILWMTNEHFLL